MPSVCCILSCKSFKTEPQRQTFPIPSDPKLKRTWIEAIGSEEFNTKCRRICINHFTSDDVEKFHRLNGEISSIPLRKYKLKPNATPSLFPGQSHPLLPDIANYKGQEGEMPFYPSPEDYGEYAEQDPIALYVDDFYVCQICETSEQLIDISGDDKAHYRDELQKLKATQSSEMDVVLNFICTPCGDKLMDFSIFRSQCEITYRKLMAKMAPKGSNEIVDAMDLMLESPQNEFDATDWIDESPANYQEDDEDADLREKMVNSKFQPNIFNKYPNLKSVVRTFDAKTVCQFAITLEKVTEGKKYTSLDLKGKGAWCFLCDEVLKNKYDLSLHQLKHRARPRKCDICEAEFATPTTLQRHIRIVHEKRKDFECGYCSKKFTHLFEVRSHMEIHQGFTYKCDVCGKTFKNKYYLKYHKIAHIPEEEQTDKMRNILEGRNASKQRLKLKEFICPTCGKIFNNRGNCNAHLRTHSDLKPFKCSVCEKSFREKNNLKSHMKIHSNEKQHKCEICERSFRQKGHLKFHLQVHTGLKPFRCQICDKDFVSNGNLTAHQIIHTRGSGKPYGCKMCEKKFRNNKALREHYRQKHFPDADLPDLPTDADIEEKLAEVFGESP